MKEIISTDGAPAAIGPYSQAVRIRGERMLFCSGQIPLDPATGKLVPGDIAVQTARVLENLGAVLAKGGANFPDVVKTTVFLTDLSDFQGMNAVYTKYFGEAPPARSTIQVAKLPAGARVEIEAIAVLIS